MDVDNFPHDAAYKAFFSNPDMMRSLLQDFVPEDFIRDFNFDTLEKCSGSYTTVDLRQRHDDIVWRVRWKDTWCYIYILLEFQNTQDYWMALRIATYTGLLWQELVNENQVKAGEKLPPVLPIVLYNGQNPWNAPLNVGELVAPVHSKLAKYQLDQEYFLLDEGRISQFLLENAKGGAGYLFRFERAKDAESVIALYHDFMNRLSDEKYEILRRSTRAWLVKLMERKSLAVSSSVDEAEEDDVVLEQKFRQWEQEFIQKGMLAGEEKGRLEGRQEGRLEGRQEGRLEGRAEGLRTQKTTLLEMLSDRFDAIPAEWKEMITCIADQSSVSRLTRALLKVRSADEYAAILAQEAKSQ